MSNGPTPLTYNGYLTQVAVLAVVDIQTVAGVVSGVDASFNTLIPQMLNYAELRIQRDLDLLPSQVSGNYTLTAGVNILAVPVADFVTVQTLSLSNGSPLLPVSKEFLQYAWPANATTGAPAYFAMAGGDPSTFGNSSTLIMVGPPPDSNYALTVYGTARLPTLGQYSSAPSASAATTFISAQLPDLLVQASMVYISEFQRNFGRIADDPSMALTYEANYQVLLKSALGEEYRKKFEASGWSSMSQSPVATPSR